MTETPVRRTMLGAALRRYRENLGYSLDQAARMLECDRSKISRIETGQRGIRALELRALLAEYGVDEAERRALSALADPHNAHGWWEEFCDVLPETYREYLSLEAMASRLLVYESHRVRGLLQTSSYAGAIAAADLIVPAGLHDRAAQATLARQKMIGAQGCPELAVVIGEEALRQMVGAAQVMREQLRHLAAISSDNAEATIQVLPFTAGAHTAMGTGPMTVLEFAQAPGLNVVHLASLPGGVFLDDPEDVACCHQAFLHLQASALSPDESVRLLQEMAEDAEKTRPHMTTRTITKTLLKPDPDQARVQLEDLARGLSPRDRVKLATSSTDSGNLPG